MPWWTIIVGYVLLASSPGRVLVLAVGIRLLRIGITPGRHPRGGRVHLQLSACERLAGAFGIRSLSGTRWAARYARAIGCRVGRNVDLRATVPVTGWATLGDDCAVEPGADLAGHWIDGGILHVGPIHVGERARIGGRSTLLPGAHVGDDAVIEPGACVGGRIPSGEVWAGSPAECVGIADDSWPAPVGRRSWWWGVVYTVSLFAFSGVPLLAAVPGLVLFGYVVRNDTTLDGLAWHILAIAPLGTLVSILSYTTLLALTIRLLSCAIRPGFHKVDSLAGWSAWLVETFADGARSVLFPFYAGLITPFWLRRLGATIGKRVEASTVTGIPKLMSAADGSFLADDTQLAPYELGGGWMRLGKASVGERSFVGNSGIVSPGHTVPDHSLIAVLANAPAHAEPHSSWMGRPAMQLPRVAEAVDAARTFDPPRRLVIARAVDRSRCASSRGWSPPPSGSACSTPSSWSAAPGAGAQPSPSAAWSCSPRASSPRSSRPSPSGCSSDASRRAAPPVELVRLAQRAVRRLLRGGGCPAASRGRSSARPCSTSGPAPSA